MNEEGEPRGLVIDLWREFGRYTGTTIEFRLTDWRNTLELVRTGEADVHGGLFESPARDVYLDFSDQMQIPLASRLFVSNKLKVSSMDDLDNIQVAMTHNGFAQEYIDGKYPLIIKHLYPNSKEVVEAAVAGEVLAFVTDYPAAMYFLHKLGSPDRFHVADTLYTKRLQAAVSDGNTELLDFISNGFAQLPREEFNRITQKWIHSESVTPRWLYPTILGSFSGLLLLFVLLYVFTLKRQVQERTCELEILSQTDMLTGLYNRKKIDELLAAEVERARRYKHQLGIVMLDLDYFKQINDTFGHTVGDDVLVAFADILRENLRASDSAGRWGGEEFLIICPETGREGVFELADKLRTVIDDFRFETVGHCTASLGGTELMPEDEIKDVFIRADIALYKSKAAGRNRVTID